MFSVDGNTGYAYGNTPNDGSQFNTLIASAYGVQLQVTPSSPFAKKDNFGVRGSSSDLSTLIDGVNSVQGLRLAYAYDRLFSITQRAGKHYDDQVMAHLGVDIPQGVSGESYYLGCHTSNLVIGEVVGTAAGTDGEGSSSVLGELAGRGLGASRKNKRIKFRAPDDGYLMALYCCVPEIEYRDYGINKINLYNSVNDYPRPEFDRLGMQPLYIWQGSGYYGVESAIYGWQYRWSELKLSYDRVHGAFNYTLRNWTSAINPVDLGYTLGGSWNVGLENRFYIPPTVGIVEVFTLFYAKRHQITPPISFRTSSSFDNASLRPSSDFSYRFINSLPAASRSERAASMSNWSLTSPRRTEE